MISSNIKRSLLLLLLITFITGATLYFTVDINTIKYLRNFNFLSIAFAILSLAIGMYFDGLRLQRLLRLLNYNLSLIAVLRVIFGNYFMAMLTPGASGGAVAQVLILKKYGVPIMEGTPVVLIRTFFSIIFLCVMLPFIFIFNPITVPYVTNEILVNASILIISIAVIGVYALQTRWFKIIIYKIVIALDKNKIKPIVDKLNQLNKGFSLLYKYPLQGIIVFIESALSLLFLYGIAPALMIAFISNVPIINILSRMIILNLILYFAPTPGGAGVAEGLFIFLMEPFVPIGTIGIVAIGWRVVAEYIPFFIGMYSVVTLYGSDK